MRNPDVIGAICKKLIVILWLQMLFLPKPFGTGALASGRHYDGRGRLTDLSMTHRPDLAFF